MQIELTRSRMRAILDALAEGRCLCNPSEGGSPWGDSEMLAVAGACLSELMRRREELQVATTDDPLRVDMEWPYTSLTVRMKRALDFALQIAGVARDRYRYPSDDEDKAYRMEVVYTRPGFDIVPVTAGTETAAEPDGACEVAVASGAHAAASVATNDPAIPIAAQTASQTTGGGGAHEAMAAGAEAPISARQCACGCHDVAATSGGGAPNSDA